MELRTRYKIFGFDDEYLAKQEGLFKSDEARVVLREVERKKFDTVEQALAYMRDKEMHYREFAILPIYSLID